MAGSILALLGLFLVSNATSQPAVHDGGVCAALAVEWLAREDIGLLLACNAMGQWAVYDSSDCWRWRLLVVEWLACSTINLDVHVDSYL